MSDPRGRFVWYQLNSADPEAAQAFYTALIGWTVEPWDDPQGGTYPMWTNQGTNIGGVMQLPEEAQQGGAPSHWLSYIYAPDVDATVARALELGGKVMVPAMDLPTVGRFAVLADPHGAIFAPFKPVDGPEPETPAGAGDFSWHELATDDYQAAFDFYSELFGWTVVDDNDMGEMGIYRIYGRDGVPAPLGGMFDRPPQMPVSWLYYVTVADLDAAVEQVKELGGQVLNGPMEVPGGDRIAQCLDPQGAAFALHVPAAG